MASNYGLNFGFRRSDESVRSIAEGRFKTPATPALLLGTAVKIDTSNAGRLVACSSGDALIPGFSGLLVQEEVMIRSIYETDVIDSYALGVGKVNALSVITSGSGTKVWLKNTAGSTRADGRVIQATTIWTTTSVTQGTYLGWDGTTWAHTTTAAEYWMVVTAVNTGAGYCEAVMLK